MSRLTSAAERLGGFVVLPRSTIRRFLKEPGGFAEDLIPWLVLAGAAASPERLGGAILLVRVAPGPGVGAILQAIFAKLDGALGFIAIAAVVHLLVDRLRRPIGFHRALDLGAHLAAPVLVLMAIGVVLSRFGIELWALPHRPLGGPTWVIAARLAAGYGWSIGLLGLSISLRLRSTTSEGESPAPRRKELIGSGTLITVLMVLAFALVARRAFEIGSGPPPPGAGVTAPVFSAKDLGGESKDLAAFTGHVVVLDFWATWCPPCVESLPMLERVSRDYADRGVVVLGLNQEPGDDTNVRSFVARHKLTFPILMDPGTVARSYGVVSLPTSFVVDQKGVVRQSFHGPPTEAELKKTLDALLGG